MTKSTTLPASRGPRGAASPRETHASTAAPHEFTPFGRTAPVLNLSASDAELLQQEPESLRILVPAAKLFAHD